MRSVSESLDKSGHHAHLVTQVQYSLWYLIEGSGHGLRHHVSGLIIRNNLGSDITCVSHNQSFSYIKILQ